MRRRSCAEQTPSRGGSNFKSNSVIMILYSIDSFRVSKSLFLREKPNLKIKEVKPQLAGAASQPHSDLAISLLLTMNKMSEMLAIADKFLEESSEALGFIQKWGILFHHNLLGGQGGITRGTEICDL